jgi:hypothetical protein
MTYFYKVGGTIARKIGGEPPANEYVAIDKEHTMRHIKNGEIIEEFNLAFPIETMGDPELKEFYANMEGKRLARGMLIAHRKKKTMKPKPSRKIKVVKKCTCK